MSERPIAIITGAGSGIGRATAVRLSAAGYDLALTGRTESKLEATVQMCEKPDRCLVIAADLTDSHACQRVVDTTLERFGRLDVLAHVAGYAPNLPIREMTPRIVDECLGANLSAAAYLTIAAWSVLGKAKKPIIVNVSSMASFDPFPGFGIYASSKVGLNMFTLVTAREGAEAGIRAVAVAPGAVETPALRAIFDESFVPRDKTLDPDHVAEVICDCITGNREFESGEVIHLPSP